MKTIIDYINESKEYGLCKFQFKVNGAEHDIWIYCYTTDTRNGFCHHAWTYDDDKRIETKVSYLNRTWERYDYQTVMNTLIKKKDAKFSKEVKDELLKMIEENKGKKYNS